MKGANAFEQSPLSVDILHVCQVHKLLVWGAQKPKLKPPKPPLNMLAKMESACADVATGAATPKVGVSIAIGAAGVKTVA